ncbi:alpha/beta hydrolase [Marinibactrum halimedae]|uniref:Alpha/beta hydrolase n=1 Tax=Marinibactrum halimedae TaxID=1444977 RepID=A0AA37WP46_9GAMM|nr:hypothetical protein [Marinibactrum halimedae]MCD9459044.1 hypothetical protein [Marinibactrum halimedae]GLS26826.1 hypothetical protein GCM10007877_25450 [Marinibactrum halimedae]
MLTRYLANMMTKSGKAPVFDDPKDYGLDYEDVTFKTKDGVTLSGWLVKGGTEKIIVQTHFGVQCSRSGYTPKGKGLYKLYKKNISFLRQAKYLVDQGYSVLMYDMRNHGNSGQGTSEYIAWGSAEAQDVLAAVGYISQHADYQNAEIGLLSICMGTSATSFAYGLEDGLSKYENIKALVSIQPLRFTDNMREIKISEKMASKINDYNMSRGGADLMESFFEHVPSIKIPTLVIQNTNDPMSDIDKVREYYGLLGGEKEMLWLDLEKNRAAAYDWLGQSPEQFTAFFNKYIGK